MRGKKRRSSNLGVAVMIGFCKVHNGAYLHRGRVSRKLAFEAFGRLDLPRNDLLQYQQYGQVFNLDRRNVLFITWIVHLEFSAIVPVANRVVLARARCTLSSIWRVGHRLARQLLITAPEVHTWRHGPKVFHEGFTQSGERRGLSQS